MITEQSTELIFTTSHKPNKVQVEKAIEYSKKYNGVYIRRREIKSSEDKFFFVVDKFLNLSIEWKDGKFFYHPSISKIKMKNIINEGKDNLIESISPDENDIILDLTAGLCSEALLIANFCKKVVALEDSFPTYLVVSEGLKKYEYKEKWMKGASEKISLINKNYKNYLKDVKSESFDVVYCDPMFENPQMKSSALNPMRRFACYDQVTHEDLNEMLRVSKKRVVIKARSTDSLWERIKFEKITGSLKSGVLFGVIDKK